MAKFNVHIDEYEIKTKADARLAKRASKDFELEIDDKDVEFEDYEHQAVLNTITEITGLYIISAEVSRL